MSTDLIKLIAKTIDEAQSNAPYYVLPQFKDKYNVMEMLPPGLFDYCHMSLVPQNVAEEHCEQMNKDWVAARVIEVIRNSDENNPINIVSDA